MSKRGTTTKAAPIICALERRKTSLRKFYVKIDPDRVKNIDPLFEHFSFYEIFNAVKKKYKKVPDNWEYERFFDLVGHLSEKKIVTAMKKAGLDPNVVLGAIHTAKDEGRGKRTARPPPPRPRKGTRVLLKKETKDVMQIVEAEAEEEEEDFDIEALFKTAPPTSRIPSSKAAHNDFSVRNSKATMAAAPPRAPPPSRRSTAEEERRGPPPPGYDLPGSPATEVVQKRIPPPPSYHLPGSPTRIESAPKKTDVAAALSAKLPFGNASSDKESASAALAAKLPFGGPPKAKEEKAVVETDVDLSKYRRMLKAGLPEGAIINAMIRDGVDESLIEVVKSPESAQPTQPKPMDKTSSASKVVKSRRKSTDNSKEEKPKQKESKFSTMHNKLLQMQGVAPAVRETKAENRGKTQISSKFGAMHALLGKQLAGPGGGKKTEIKVDEEKAKNVAAKFAAAAKSKELKKLTADSPEAKKYFMMQKNKLPEGAIRNCLERDGFDPDSFFNMEAEPQQPPQEESNANYLPANNNLRNTQQSQPRMGTTNLSNTQQSQPRMRTTNLSNTQQSQPRMTTAKTSEMSVQGAQQSTSNMVRSRSQYSRSQSQYNMQRSGSQRNVYFQPVAIAGSRVTDVWSVEWSQDYKRPYYFNNETGESQWDPPPELTQ